MLKACWILTLLGASLAAILVLDIFLRTGSSAPQEAAAAAIACALCVVPYVFTRAVEGMQKPRPVAPRVENLADPRDLLNRREH